MNAKPLLASKSIWFNVIMLIAQTLPGIAQYIPQPYGLIATTIGNLVLRLVTSQPIALTPTATPPS